MRSTTLMVLALAGSLQACTAKAGPQASCEASVKEALLNPETAKFYDFVETDPITFGAATLPTASDDPTDFAAGTIAKVRKSEIDSAAKLYRMRVRSEAQLGNTVTKQAFCRLPVEGIDLCHCTLVD